MKYLLTVFVIGNKKINCKYNNVLIKNVEKINIDEINKYNSLYISFINSDDDIKDNYFDLVIDKLKDNPDSIFLNYFVNYNYSREPKINKDINNLKERVPKKHDYIFSYVYKKDLFLKFINNYEDKIFEKRDVINAIVYIHNPKYKEEKVFDLMLNKEVIKKKNIIYMDWYCNGTFNGYITWLINLGKSFKNKKIAILYSKITDVTYKRFSKYFDMLEYSNMYDYVCESFIDTYSTYFYPINIYSTKQSSIFIHGIMSDYPNACRYKEDIYDKYIAVSKIARDSAYGYFPTDEITYIYNPYIVNKNIGRELKLISTMRNSKIKGFDRIKILASVLDELKIPYTWQVFTDIKEENKGGLVFRDRVEDVTPYLIDADYLVHLSSSEAFSYSILESLCLKTKLVVTPLPMLKEVNINKNNAIVIPFEYFDDKEKLKEVVRKMYKMKDKKFKYNYPSSKYSRYNDVF